MEKLKILFVEDDDDLSTMLSTYFRFQGYEVRTAGRGDEALKIGQEEDLSIVVLDIHLPDMDGYEIYRQLRQYRRMVDVPVLFLTDKHERGDKLQGLELGVIGYVTKPFDIEELELRIRNAIQRTAQPSQINAVTELPDVQLLNDRLAEIMKRQDSWSLLLLSVIGLDKQREIYGFVAADEVMRAVAHMARSAVSESGNESDFIAHFSPQVLVVFTTSDRAKAIRSRLETRVRQSFGYFYRPEEKRQSDEAGYLDLKTGIVVRGRKPFQNVDELKAKMAASIGLAAKKPQKPR